MDLAGGWVGPSHSGSFGARVQSALMQWNADFPRVGSSARSSPRRWVAGSLVVAAAVAGGDAHAAERDRALCLPRPAERVALLADVAKPMPATHYANLLRDVSLDLPAEAELSVFTVTSDTAAPRQFLGRVCKPYGNADIAVGTAKDAAGGLRDCGALPAQVPPDLRARATRFCALRSDLQRRVDGVAGVERDAPPANVPLLDAIDATAFALAERSGARALYVFSDMLHHGDWYSHFDLEWTAWQFGRVARSSRTLGPAPEAEYLAGLAVRILYVPRVGLTAARRPREAHQHFWRAYFGPAEVEFRALAPLPAYAVAPLMRKGGDPASMAQELEALEDRARDAERELTRVARETEVVEERRREARARSGRREAAREDLVREEDALHRELERLRRELAEREAVEAARADAVASAASPPGETPEEEAAGAEAAATGEAPDRPDAPSAVAAAQTREAGACDMRLAPRFREVLGLERYAGDRGTNYGGATIVVRFAVDDRGETVDGEVAVVAEDSEVERPEHFDALTEDALGLVRDWSFLVEAPRQGGECGGLQDRIATFTYRQRCVGRPVPSCRSVRSDVRVDDFPGRAGGPAMPPAFR